MTYVEKISLGIVGIFFIIAIISPFWLPNNPYSIDTANILSGPSKEHWLGTDALGRDLMSRILIGTSFSIAFALIASVVTVLVGTCIGVLAGYKGGVIDITVQILVNVFQGVPGFCLMIALAGVLSPGMTSIIIAVVISGWASFSRVIRGEVMAIKNKNYVEGIKVLGAPPYYIVRYYILPNIYSTVILLFTMRLSSVILSVSSLSYLGLGIQPPLADWGSMVSEGQTYYRSAPLLLYAPGICIILLCTTINILGEYYKQRVNSSGVRSFHES